MSAHKKEMQGKLLSPRTVLATNTKADTVTVVGANGRKIVSAVEDTWIAILEYEFTAAVVESLDAVDESSVEYIDNTQFFAVCNENSRGDSVHYNA